MDTSSIMFFINDGPSRERLFDHVKYLHEKNAPIIPIRFDTYAQGGINAEIIGIRINAIKHADNTGNYFILEGSCIIDVVDNVEERFSQHEFRARYNSRRRKGRLELLS